MADPAETHASDEIQDLTSGMNRIYKELDSFKATFGALAGSIFICMVCRIVLEYSETLHWVVGAEFSAFMILFTVWAIQTSKKSFLRSTRSACAMFLSTGLFVSVIVAAWVSYTLCIMNIGTYELTVTRTYSMDVFTYMYFYKLADLVPGIKIVKTLHITSPVEPRDFMAGCPILVFRIVVLWFLFVEFQSWRKVRKEDGKERPGDIGLLLTVVVIFIAVSAKHLG